MPTVETYENGVLVATETIDEPAAEPATDPVDTQQVASLAQRIEAVAAAASTLGVALAVEAGVAPERAAEIVAQVVKE